MILDEGEAALAARLRRALVRELVARGVLRSERWRAAFEVVPRHVFAPQCYQRTTAGRIHFDARRPADRKAWLSAVYTDDSVVTQLGPDGNATSSSTQPSVMALMLEALQVNDGDRVLEVGTGTGYNAALLSHGIGADKVTSVDIDADLIEPARAALAACGFQPHLAVADGLLGYASLAPYDRIIGTCSVRRIPKTWLTQTRPGGVIVANLGFGVVALRVSKNHAARGRFRPEVAAFIEARQADSPPPLSTRDAITLSQGEGTVRPATIYGDLDCEEFQFLVKILMPCVNWIKLADTQSRVEHYILADVDTRAWARTTSGGDDPPFVKQAGSRLLWDELETLHGRWVALGRPTHDRLGLDITAEGDHLIWVDKPGRTVSLGISKARDTRAQSAPGDYSLRRHTQPPRQEP